MRCTPSARTTAAVATAVAVTAVLTGTGVAGAAVDAGKSVFVVNDASRPVPTRATGTTPVTGTVEVGNLPSTQAVTGTVSVDNLPQTQEVTGTVGLDPAANTVRTQGETVVAFQQRYCLDEPSTAGVLDEAETGLIDVSAYETVRVLVKSTFTRTTTYRITTESGPAFVRLAEGRADQDSGALHVFEVPGTALRIRLQNRSPDTADFEANCPDVVVWGR
jgi:hypothetical protein